VPDSAPALPPDAAVYRVLDELGISYERHDHPAAFTVDEAVEHWEAIRATHCKNLFLRNKKGNRHYLVVAGHQTPVDLKQLCDKVGDDRLSFGSAERLMAHLGITPGSVSPFGLINDRTHAVQVILDAAVDASERVAFHPNVNTTTLVIARDDLRRFLAWCGNPVRVLKMTL
jgi:Ala-tRNA(Pro) deacylase